MGPINPVPQPLSISQLKDQISQLTDESRLALINWLRDDYCTECGAVAFCDCPTCVCECRKRRGREFQEQLQASGKSLRDFLKDRGELPADW